MGISDGPILYFDGVCNLCNSVVKYIIRHDRKGVFRFASLQSEAGKKASGEMLRAEKESGSGRSVEKQSGSERSVEKQGGSGRSAEKESGSERSVEKQGGRAEDGKGPSSVILFYKGRYYAKSDAALKVAWLLGGVGWLLMPGYLLPRFVRNTIYDAVAERRYKWFGKKDECMIPTPELKARFLDE